MTGTVLILGASGKIGQHAAMAFDKAGWQVHRYDRARGDMPAQARGADVIVNGLNPPNYHNWARLIPQITAEVIAAGRASGATVIVPGNVYNFGATPGLWSENTPQAATTRKGRIRIEMERTYRDSGVQTIILRAGNFIDPARDDDVLGLFLLRELGKGRITAGGDADAQQAYCYLPDWARAAVLLADKRDTLAAFEDIPFPGHSFSVNQLRDLLAELLNRDLRVVGFPWWLMRLSAPFWELARELNEMRYLYNTSHSLAGDKFDRLLPGFEPTPLREAIAASLPGDIHPDQPVPGQRRAVLPGE